MCLTLKTCRPSLTTWLASNTNLLGQWENKQLTQQWRTNLTTNIGGNKSASFTWKNKDKAGCQSSNQWYHPTNIWDEEGQKEGGDKPNQRLQDAPPALTADAHFHLLALETQPQSLYNGPAWKIPSQSTCLWIKCTDCTAMLLLWKKKGQSSVEVTAPYLPQKCKMG